MSVLDVQDLTVDLMTLGGVVRAVDGVSFHLEAGETVTIIGESGSGKSTTAMALLRLLPDDLAVISGRAEIDGHDVVSTRKHVTALRGRSVALIPQDPMTALNPIATIEKQMVEAIRLAHRGLSKKEASAKALDLLRQVHLSAPERRLKSYPHQLSGGMLQRVLIAMALSTGAGLIVADEPTSALDVTVQAGILDLILEIQEQTGAAVLLITHDLGVARLMSDRIHVMKSGRFVESGPVAQVVDHPQHEYTQKLLAAIPALGPWEDPEAEAEAAPAAPAASAASAPGSAAEEDDAAAPATAPDAEPAPAPEPVSTTNGGAP